MKTLNSILIVFLIVGCIRTNQQDSEWIKVKESNSFADYFKFGIENPKSDFFEAVQDSLTRQQPAETCKILRLVDTWDNEVDTLDKLNFFIEDQCGWDIDYKIRNLVIGGFYENDSLIVKYRNSNFESFEKIVKSLQDTSVDSYEVPEIRKIVYNGIEYTGRTIGIFLYTRRLPDSLNNKTNWEKIIAETNNILSIYKSIRDEKSISIFGKSIEELESEENRLIRYLVPIYINIFFTSPSLWKPPPPPEPPKMDEDFEIVVEGLE